MYSILQQQIDNSQKMLLQLENRVLRTSNTRLRLQLAFSKLKNNLLSYHCNSNNSNRTHHHQPNNNNVNPITNPSLQPQLPCQQYESGSTTGITNKALYLDYVQRVLQQKQQSLLTLQQQLSVRQQQINQKQYTKNIQTAVVMLQQVKLMDRKIRAIQHNMGIIRQQQYISMYRKFQQQCQSAKYQMEQIIKRQYMGLVQQKKILRAKLSQFAELEAYQKYLNQLHHALQVKSMELVKSQKQRERQGNIWEIGEAKQQQQGQGEEANTDKRNKGKIKQRHQQDFNTDNNNKQQSNQSHTSNRKRIKIFNVKARYYQGGFADSTQNKNNNFGQVIDQTFAKQGHQSSSINNINGVQSLGQNKQYLALPNSNNNNHATINQSSAILGQNSQSYQQPYSIAFANSNNNNVDGGYQNFQIYHSTNPAQNISSNKKKTNLNSQKQLQKQLQKQKQQNNTDFGTQVNVQNLAQTEQRLKKDAIKLQTLKKWINYSIFNAHNTNNNVQHTNTSINRKKCLTLNLWRLNTCFDSSIPTTASNSLQIYQKLWQNQQNKLTTSSKMFPYNQLSIKRKKYAELMFDLELKIFHRVKIQHLLKNIIMNKYRKERLVFYMYFCKFVKNSSNVLSKNTKQKSLKQTSKLGYNFGTEIGTRTQSHSDMGISTISSQVLKQQKINAPNKKSLSNLNNNNGNHNGNHNKSTSMSKQHSLQKLANNNNKQNNDEKQIKTKPKQQQLAQQNKLKQILLQKQRTQKLLATQCVKLQGLIKMSIILTKSTFSLNNYFFKKLQQSEYQQKLTNLTSQLNGLEFRFDLVMTKCKLGLANNSNKISTLENLLDFTNIIR